MVEKTNEQKLTDLCFLLFFTGINCVKHFKNLDRLQQRVWVAQQLKNYGFPTVPTKNSWGVLTKGEDKSAGVWIDIDEFVQEIEELREALGFYADGNHVVMSQNPIDSTINQQIEDGAIARNALKLKRLDR